MAEELYYNTINSYLQEVLMHLMEAEEFKQFRLVGGTSLSLQIGHRKSIDIDLFSDAEYGSIDFTAIDVFLQNNYPYVDRTNISEPGMGISYFIGSSRDNCIKLDVFYTDPFVFPLLETNNIRLAPAEEIIAMKLHIISQAGRKKDFWDLHALTDRYSLNDMLAFHERRYPYTHDAELIRKRLSDFSLADEEADPECLRGQHWGLIKLDMIDFAKESTHK